MNMKRMKTIVALALGLCCATAGFQAQNLEAALNAKDQAAGNFRTAQCDFVWDQYQKVVDDHDYQKGTMYFRRQGNDVQMAADITSPDKKYVLFTGSLVSVYQPSIDQVTEYNPGKNKADFASFLVLGFGGRGHDLEKSFDVNYAGMEAVQDVNAAKLELTPRSQRVRSMFQTITLWIDLCCTLTPRAGSIHSVRVRSMFQTITLWIDPARGVSVQQRFSEPSGDYRVAKYSNIEINHKISGDVFKLKTTSHTKVIKPNG